MAATLGTILHTWLHGRFVGRDEFGNRYYEAKCQRPGEAHKRRWVMYRGIVDASKVPPAWHGWLHYTLAAPLSEARVHGWQKPHLPNLTGTLGRYLPKGHLSRGGVRAPSTADYQPWRPE